MIAVALLIYAMPSFVWLLSSIGVALVNVNFVMLNISYYFVAIDLTSSSGLNICLLGLCVDDIFL